MSNETPKKPSELLVERADVILAEWVARGVEEVPVVRLASGVSAILEYLDAQAERRTAWEAKVETELAARNVAQPSATASPGLLSALVAALHADSRDACQAQVAAIFDARRAAEGPVKS